MVVDGREMAGNSADYETNPIVRQASREAGLPPNFHGLALPPVGKAGQEQVSGATANLPETAILPPAGGSRNSAAASACFPSAGSGQARRALCALLSNAESLNFKAMTKAASLRSPA